MRVEETVVPRLNHYLPHPLRHRCQSLGMCRILRQIVHLKGIRGQIVELVIVETVVDELPVPVP